MDYTELKCSLRACETRIRELQKIIQLIDEWVLTEFGTTVPLHILSHKLEDQDQEVNVNLNDNDGSDYGLDDSYEPFVNCDVEIKTETDEIEDDADDDGKKPSTRASTNYSLRQKRQIPVKDDSIEDEIENDSSNDKIPNTDEAVNDADTPSSSTDRIIKRARATRSKTKVKSSINFPCTKCVKKFRKKNQLRQHMKRIHPRFTPESKERPRIPCSSSDCEKSFLRLTHLRIHLKQCHPDLPIPERKNKSYRKNGIFECEICNKIFNNQWNLEAHLKTHDADRPRPFFCEICGNSYFSEHNLKAHQTNVHTNKPVEKNWLCPDCGKSFATQWKLERHSIVHQDRSTRPTVTCHICGIKLLNQVSLGIHINGHTKEKSHQCPYCEKSFLQKSYLNIHIKSYHQRCLRFVCTYEGCNEKYKQRSTLLYHIEQKHNTATYTCDFGSCLKTFENRYSLDAHIRRAHRKDREDFVFKCMLCDFRFNSQLWLDRHVTRAHEIGYECTVPNCQKKFENARALAKHKKIHKNNLTTLLPPPNDLSIISNNSSNMSTTSN